MTRIVIRAALLALIFLPAVAQAQPHLQLLGGATEAAGRHPFFGAAVGLRLGPVELDIEGGRFHDILPEGVAEAINDLQEDRGLPVQAIASVPAFYALGSLRLIPGIGPVRPFLSVGAGAARVEPRLDVSVEGISFGDVFGLTSFGAYTVPMVAGGAGLRIDGGRVHVEGGYRYVAIISDFETLNLNTVHVRVNQIYGAVGVGF